MYLNAGSKEDNLLSINIKIMGTDFIISIVVSCTLIVLLLTSIIKGIKNGDLWQ